MDAVCVLVDEELIVGSVDRVVQQRCGVAGSRCSRTSRSGRYRVSALRTFAGMASPMPSSSPRSATYGLSGSPSAILTDTPARAFVGEDAQDAGVFGEEQGAVGEDADLVFGRREEACPDVAGNRPAVRVDRSQFFGASPRGERTPASGHRSASSAPTRSASAARLFA